jgi:hypothetical protein
MKRGTLAVTALIAVLGLTSYPGLSQGISRPVNSNPSDYSKNQGKVVSSNSKKASPPTSGSCKTPQGTIQNCWQGVVWEAIPNSYSDFAGGYAYVGTNTIVKRGNVINFDFYGDGTYVRYSGNCRAGVLAITKASDNVFVDPNSYFPANDYQRRGLNFACSRR